MGRLRDDDLNWTREATIAEFKIADPIDTLITELRHDGFSYEEIESLIMHRVMSESLRHIMHEKLDRKSNA